MQIVAGECGGGGGDAVRTPQSTHSAPNAHTGRSEPGLPLSLPESEAKKHVRVVMQMLPGVTRSIDETSSASILNSKTASGPPSSRKPSEA
jgi:hypothetical protein